MSALSTVRKLDSRKERAASLQAQGDLGTEAIAEAVGITPMSLWRWNKLPEFRDRVAEINRDLDRETYATGLARKRNRVTKLAAVADKLYAQIMASPKPNYAIVREWRALLEQIARELGQWTEKLDLNATIDDHRVVVTQTEVVLTVERDTIEAEYVVAEPVAITPEQARKELQARWGAVPPEWSDDDIVKFVANEAEQKQEGAMNREQYIKHIQSRRPMPLPSDY